MNPRLQLRLLTKPAPVVRPVYARIPLWDGSVDRIDAWRLRKEIAEAEALRERQFAMSAARGRV